jgi:hypothetical protein
VQGASEVVDLFSDQLPELCKAELVESLEVFAFVLLVVVDITAENGLLAADAELEIFGNAITTGSCRLVRALQDFWGFIVPTVDR